MLCFQQQQCEVPRAGWPPIHLASLAAVTAHNACHLAAVRQIARMVGRGR